MNGQCSECSLQILAFPYQQFRRQEPGSNAEIKEFAMAIASNLVKYSKICVNGDDAHPLWKCMKIQPKKERNMLGNTIKWNFTKFLIDRTAVWWSGMVPWKVPGDREQHAVLPLELYKRDALTQACRLCPRSLPPVPMMVCLKTQPPSGVDPSLRRRRPWPNCSLATPTPGCLVGIRHTIQKNRQRLRDTDYLQNSDHLIARFLTVTTEGRME